MALELFSVAAKLFLDKTEYDKDVKSADSQGKTLAENLGKYIEKAKKILGGIAIAKTIQKASSAVWDLAKATSQAGDRIDKQSQALGLSRKAFQEWDYILGQSGASIDSMAMTMKTMNEAILANSDDTAAALSKLGLSAAHLQSIAPEEQFEAIVRALQKMPASGDKTALAIRLFGRNAQSLMPLLNSAEDSIDELRARAYELGLVMSDEDVDASVAFGDALDDLSKTWTAVKYKFGGRVLPTFTAGLVALSNSLGRISNSIATAFKTNNWSIVFSTITEEITNLVPGFVTTVVNTVKGFFDNVDKFVDIAGAIMVGLAQAIEQSIPILLEKLPAIEESILGALAKIAQSIANAFVKTINSVFGTDLPEVTGVFQWVMDNKESIIAAIRGIIAAFAVGKIATFVASLNPLKLAFTLVAAAIALVATNWDAIKDWIGKTWKTTVEWVSKAWDTVQQSFANAKQWVSEKYQVTVTWIQEKWTEVKSAFAELNRWTGEKIHNIFVAIGTTVDGWITTIKGWIENPAAIGDAIVHFGVDLSEWILRIFAWMEGKSLKQIVLDIGAGVDDWLKSVKQWIDNKVESFQLNVAVVSEWLETIKDWITNGVRIGLSFFGGGGLADELSIPSESELSTTGGGAGHGFAKGLNYVPYDGFRAVLHRGETVLNQQKSKEYRQNQASFNAQTLYDSVSEAVAMAIQGIQVNMSGKAVGNLVAEPVSRNIYQKQYGRRFGAG